MKLSWKDNRGFTLVELIITMAVMTIVAGAIGVLMMQGSKSYSSAKSELDLQMESQTLLAQLNTMIMESNSAHYDDTNHILTLYQIKTIPATAGAVSGGAVTKEVKDTKFIQLKNNKLYLYEHDHDQTKPASGGSVDCGGCGKYTSDGLLADYMEDFTVTPKGALPEGNNAITVHLKMKSGKRTYDAEATTKIRNKLVTYP